MPDMMDRITINPNVCHGKACIKGTRIMVSLILQYLANGDNVEDILSAYPQLKRDDIAACLQYAAALAQETVLPVELSS
jgi:uncharacterized protein (DUF433 family)